MDTLRIATRQSALAMWQANHIKAQLQILHPQLKVVLHPLTSKGDKILDVPLAKIGGKGLFVKELEHAILRGEADIAVHSMKDLPMEFPEGLGLAVICEREDPRDAWVSNTYPNLSSLPTGAVVGTSSLRRQSQLLAQHPNIEVRFLRGNVNTRLAKLDNEDYDGIILAAAGLKRLAMGARIRDHLTPEQCLPAAGQGAIGIECRLDDSDTRALIAPLNHQLSAEQVLAERAMNRRLEGGCQVPIGGYAIHEHGELWLRGLVANPDGSTIITDEQRGSPADAEQLGIALANNLLARGADKILLSAYDQPHL